MNQFLFVAARRFVALAVTLVMAAWAVQTQAQPFIVSTVPAIGATGVSPSAAVVFTFSEQMDTITFAQFFDSAFNPLPTTSAWSANDTVLTCTPSPAFPANTEVYWIVDGESLIGDPIEGEVGYFTTGGSGGNIGTGTNQLTAFMVGKTHFYNQSSTAAPTLDPDVPYLFLANTILASNRTATSVSVILPTAAVSNLTRNIAAPEAFLFFAPYQNLNSFNSLFPAGDYLFNVSGTPSQQVAVNLPASLAQPNAPRISNYTAAQSVNATQPFQLTWNAFQGGTAADHISVSIDEVFQSPDIGAPGALNGTATSIQIPAGTLQPSSNYTATISFFRSVGSSNATYTTSAYVATSTEFTVATAGGTTTAPLILTNMTLSGGNFAFDVISSPSQLLTVEYSSTMLTNQWQTLITTNNVTGLARITHAVTNNYFFYRARKGS